MTEKRDASRITVLMDTKIIKRLRAKQAESLRQSNKNVSFSYILNEELAKSLGVHRNDL